MKECVSTPCGALRGTREENGVISYKGIPYAKAGRWEYPTPVTEWQGELDATAYGAACYQQRAYVDESRIPERAFYEKEFRRGCTFGHSEDCLFLNIWAKNEISEAPVLFFVHGGGYISESADELPYDGSRLAEQGLVVVSFNYRLGPLGFCCMPETKEQTGHGGNFAFYDQLCALQWVQRNIRAFGGNPDCVTLLGQSAGAMCGQQLCSSPLTKGMIHRAVLLSGGGALDGLMPKVRTPESLYPFWEAVRKECGAADFEAFRQVPVQQLWEAYYKVRTEKKDAMSGCGAVVDGVIFPQTVAASVKDGTCPKIPYILGSTGEDLMAPVFGWMADQWAKGQEPSNPDRTWLYEFDRKLPGDDKGAWHGADLWYWFGNLDRCWRPFSDADYRLSEQMMETLVRFASYGNPNGGTLPRWESSPNMGKRILHFDADRIEMRKRSWGRLLHTMLFHKGVGE